MRHFLRIAQNVDITGVLLELNRAPYLWDANRARTTYAGTPHGQASDLWIRFRAPDSIEGLHSHQTEYRSVYWPAWHELPSLRPLVRALKNTVDAVELGSILITRLPPGASILPHNDKGSWAAEWFNCKCHVTLAGRSLSRCLDEEVVMQAGDVFTFDNLLEHSVFNPGEIDRVAMIVSMRCEN